MSVEDSNSALPRHVAVIMDGNGRWAKSRGLPRTAGHKKGVDATRSVVQSCARLGIPALTLFAFSSENWRRPEEEVSALMELFVSALKGEAKKLADNNVRLGFIGEREAFSQRLQDNMQQAEALTQSATGMRLTIAANYGGRWDMAQAAKQLARRVVDGELQVEEIDAERAQEAISLSSLPEVDLLIRTGGEQRLSNFLLWQSAYAELYFTDTYWPDFHEDSLQKALDDYACRQRRYGMTGEQVVRSA